MNLRIISAGAGSGKTYRLMLEMVALLKSGVRANGIIATTFTKKAAAELQERVRSRLLEEGLTQEAEDLTNALIGTVHGLGVKLLQRFAFEAGVSPKVEIIADEDQQVLFNLSLATVLTQDRVEEMERLNNSLGLSKRAYYDWRREVRQLTEVARANDFSIEVLEKSKRLSFETFRKFLEVMQDEKKEDLFQSLQHHLDQTITALDGNGDGTKKTQAVISTLKAMRNELQLRGFLYWHQWIKISKQDVGAKSKKDILPLKEFTEQHRSNPGFHEDIQNYIGNLFDITIEAIREYDRYKKSRGLIDYTDMEVLIKRLLEHEHVQSILKAELDLLMVDEFQDTSPIQLEIFLKLSHLAKHSIWVGDPKQSIYGFRGADPTLMQAIIKATGGVKPENIQTHSWRSREDIVFATNAIFTKAFSQLPENQVALSPKRLKKASQESINKTDEPNEVQAALWHWHFEFEGEGKRLPGKPWMENCLAHRLKQFLAQEIRILPKGQAVHHPAKPGDIAILCRSNAECQTVAEALHRAGLKAAISRNGLLNTAEAKLIMACLRYILQQEDSLSVAEILLLASRRNIEEIVEDRMTYLENIQSKVGEQWAASDPFIQLLDSLRGQVVEFSSSEVLNLLLDSLDLRRIIVQWGKVDQRLDNVDVLRRLALQYEEACNRMHSAASLGGFLLWLNDLERKGEDFQGSGEGQGAVNVLTYHKSKGLEWPIVICHSLEGSLRENIWGINIIPEKERVDLNNVLGNRWLRYWVNPYADQFKKTTLDQLLNESPEKEEAYQRALQEEARLLYVGITRARDYLIFPTRARPTKWLNRVWNKGEESIPTLDPHSNESPWEWKGNFLDIQTEKLTYSKDFSDTDPEENIVQYIERPTGKQNHPAYLIDLRRGSLSLPIDIRVLKGKPISKPLELTEDVDAYTVAKLFKACITADYLSYSEKERTILFEGLLTNFDLKASLDAEMLMQYSKAWWEYVDRHFAPKKIYRKYPIRYFFQNRLFETIVDLVLETDDQLIFIQNSSFSGESKRFSEKIQTLGDWLFLSQEGLKDILGYSSVRAFVHFVLSATLVETEVKATEKVIS